MVKKRLLTKLKAQPIETPILFDMPEKVETKRLVLRKPELTDIQSANEAVAETFDELNLWMPWAKEPVSLKASEEFVKTAIADFAARKSFVFFIIDKQTNEFLGSMGYPSVDWNIPSFEIGYWIRKSAKGKGYISEAVNELTRVAIAELGVKKVFLKIDTENEPSKAVARKCNFELEGTLRFDSVDNNGDLRDTEIWSVIAMQEQITPYNT